MHESPAQRGEHRVRARIRAGVGVDRRPRTGLGVLLPNRRGKQQRAGKQPDPDLHHPAGQLRRPAPRLEGLGAGDAAEQVRRRGHQRRPGAGRDGRRWNRLPEPGLDRRRAGRKQGAGTGGGTRPAIGIGMERERSRPRPQRSDRSRLRAGIQTVQRRPGARVVRATGRHAALAGSLGTRSVPADQHGAPGVPAAGHLEGRVCQRPARHGLRRRSQRRAQPGLGQRGKRLADPCRPLLEGGSGRRGAGTEPLSLARRLARAGERTARR